MKKLNQKKRPNGAGALAPASPTPKPANNSLLAILERNLERATEPGLKQRLRNAINTIEARRA
jgi:hypothetical protein